MGSYAENSFMTDGSNELIDNKLIDHQQSGRMSERKSPNLNNLTQFYESNQLEENKKSSSFKDKSQTPRSKLNGPLYPNIPYGLRQKSFDTEELKAKN
tara:strand:- start:406 stop:699 length:294 start_codon:yes stop_codon:yes gene_type:complete